MRCVPLQLLGPVARKPPVADLEAPTAVNEDVGALQVAVKELVLVHEVNTWWGEGVDEWFCGNVRGTNSLPPPLPLPSHTWCARSHATFAELLHVALDVGLLEGHRRREGRVD